MPISSQARKVIGRGMGQQQFPIRHYSSISQKNMSFDSHNHETIRYMGFNGGFNHCISGFSDTIHVANLTGKLLYDPKTKSLRWPGLPGIYYYEEESSKNEEHKRSTTKTKDHETKQPNMAVMGCRKRRTVYIDKKPLDSNIEMNSSFVKDAKFLPTPPGTTPKKRNSRQHNDETNCMSSIPISAPRSTPTYITDADLECMRKSPVPIPEQLPMIAADNRSHAADNRSHTADNRSHAANNRSHAAGNKIHAADNISHAADNRSHTADNNTADHRSHGDVSDDNKQQHIRPVEKIKSLLEEVKESVSYDNRLLPSMELKKHLPPSSPNSVVFSLRNNDDYSHQDIMDLFIRETGTKPVTIQYDPVNVRVGSSDVSSRWIVKFGSLAETQFVERNGLEINGEKVIIETLDSILRQQYIAYRHKMSEETTLPLRKLKKKRTVQKL